MENPLRATHRYRSRFKQLNKEITTYLAYLELTPEEQTALDAAFQELKQVILAFKPTAEVYMIGSAATKLKMYNCDLDISVPNVRLADLFKYMQLETRIDCEFINCQHPIVQGALEGFKFDISASRASVLRDVEDAKKLNSTEISLLQILKEVLRTQKLNSLRDGGISSFLLLQMVKAYTKVEVFARHPFAHLLLNFLQFWSGFQWRKLQITDGVIRSRTFVFKPTVGRTEPQLVIIVGGDEIGGAIQDFPRLEEWFSGLYATLMGFRTGRNLLSTIISPDEAADERREELSLPKQVPEI